MNSKVRRYEPLFLSPQFKFNPRSPTRPYAASWKSKLNHEVTICYNRIKRQAQQSKCSMPESNELQQVKSLHSFKGEVGVRSCSTQSNTNTPVKLNFESSSYLNLSPLMQRTAREREIENYYSQRVQLLQEECSYLRKEFISHCLKHHRTEFEGGCSTE